MSQTVSSPSEPIAIVGSGCRFPGGVSSPSSLWELLERPVDLRQEITRDRWSTAGFYHVDGTRHGTTNVCHSYLLSEDVRVFDAAFFNISPNEADAMDPQQRLLLETVYEALEAGGHTIEGLHGSDTSVYVGTMAVDYHDNLLRDHNTIPKYFATGVNRAIISNRVSYFFNWHGPSMTIDTACSSSLVAVHQAVQSLRNGDSHVSVACGTQVLLGYDMYIAESQLKMLSPSGRSRMWDADADGYARGEGVAAIVLKRLSDAISDGDHIESIIRETGVNHDGFSNGITVPSTAAQASLIRQTYARAGLDPENNPDDRPQYFEAHGTGTPAGDPKEAAAIYDCFGRHNDATGSTPLYVGSIKTVIGHLEGTAGLAGLLKASASIQKGLISPNLYFDRLNPQIEPFYKGLEVPTNLQAWPPLPPGVPRRVSVNSFGFGGANARAILEEYMRPSTSLEDCDDKSSNFSPFVFSALSETSLVAQLEQYSQFFRTRADGVDASDLAWTLHSRKSQLPTKIALSASTIQQLRAKIDSRLAAAKLNAGTAIGIRSSFKPAVPCILGVFTGQGAQWPAMGARLIRSSNFARQRIRHLEMSLATLPVADSPEWSLEEEMLAGDETSRITEPALSQPVCTAIQIVLVDLLQAAGIGFSSVVGHSSGEIAAAYAAGFLSAHDSIRIAYYRGLYAHLAGNQANHQKGAMLAAGLSWEEAQELVTSKAFKDRLDIAAHKSAASVTLSGDEDAIGEVEEVLQAQKKFARRLKVSVAYHSHHVLPCGDPYLNALRACNIQIHENRSSNCSWFSSVIPSTKSMEPVQQLRNVYWRDNMTTSVLFADAVKNAILNDGQISLALEIGPHPALKGPAMQNIADVRQTPLPYFGTLSRGNDDVEAFSDTLGSLWTHLGPNAVDLQSFDKIVKGNSLSHNLVVELPSYQWDHERVYWSESRRSKRIRGRKQAPHELLGTLSPESNGHDMRWSNLLKVSEMVWMEGHQLQNLVVFPAAGYVAMAIEACRSLAGDKMVELFELHNLSIPKAITFEERDVSIVETLITLTAIEHHPDHAITAGFSVYSAPFAGTRPEHDMELAASGAVRILLGNPDPAALLPCSVVDNYNLSEVDPDRVYTMFSELGYDYTGPFRTMSRTKRRLNQASVLIDTYAYSNEEPTIYLVHPTVLDVAIQTVVVNPQVCACLPKTAVKIPAHSTVADGDVFSANIDLFSEGGESVMLLMEDLKIKPFAPATATDDRSLFWQTELGLATPDGASITAGIRPTAEEAEIASLCERVCYYYLRKWKAEISEEDWDKGQPHHAALRNFMDHVLENVARDSQLFIDIKWSQDTTDQIKALVARYPHDVDLKIISTVGENIPAAVRGVTTILEHMLPNNLLDDFYKKGLGFARYNSFLASMMKQVVHRYPRAKILEIGAGTGGATKAVLENIGDKFSSYTYTDISAGFFEKASELFRQWHDKMTFKVLDVERTPTDQGYAPGTYDIIIASNVLHATFSLQKTLENTRSLLKPGGYLMLLELTNDGPPIRIGNIMGGLPGWWLGVTDGRTYAPTVTPDQWHNVLRKSGFAGIDTITPEIDGLSWPFSIIAAQAVDDRIAFLRQPLAPTRANPVFLDNLVILGCSRIATEISDNLRGFFGNITILGGLPTEAEAVALKPMSTFVNLVDLDSPIFKAMTNNKMEGMKRLFELARHVLWLTRGALLGEEPYHSASLAFCRTLSNEARHISLNVLDISRIDENISKVISEQLLRQCALEDWDEEQLLWSKEPEAFLQHGRLLIPRIIPNADQNARLNATRRTITKIVPVSTSNFSIHSGSNAVSLPTLVEDVLGPGAHKDSREALVHVAYSSLMALRLTPDIFLFLAIGKVGAQGHNTFTLSTTNSRTTAPISSTPAVYINSNIELDRFCVAVSGELLAASLMENLAPGSSLLVHCSDSDRFFATALSRRAAAQSVRVTFSCAYDSHDTDPSWIRFSARTSSYAIQKALLPVRPTHFLDLNSPPYPDSRAASNFGLSIAQVLPLDCRRIDLFDLFQHRALLPRSFDRELLVARLQDAVTGAEITTSALSAQKRGVQDIIIPLKQIHDRFAPHSAATVVHWPADGEIGVEVRPTEGRKLFAQDKTYVLFGLSGQVGQSLCEWMVANGAGCVVLTSRRPKVDQRWLDSFEGTGATVKILAVDVTDRSSIDGVLETIRSTCPPIAGVANGAMVLSDSPFSEMSTDMMLQALGPKIDGSYNLDQAFYNVDLDFFVLFSSISCAVGTSGQSNYVAANGYLNGLARQRRSRGLAASAWDIGLVIGIGYASAAGQHLIDSLQKYGITPLSEPDVQLAFAESIQAGYANAKDKKPGSFPAAAVMTSGLRPITANEKDIVWYNNPIFSHLIVDDNGESGAQYRSRNNATATLSIREQIARAASMEEVLQSIRDSFSGKLRIVLQSTDQEIAHDVPLVGLGIDSLVAVEVRSWFLKVLKVDIPVLKLLDGSSLDEICQVVVKKLPKDLVAQIGTVNATAAASLSNPEAPTLPLSSSKVTSASMDSASSSDLEVTPGLQTPPVDTPSSTITRQTSLSSLPFSHKDSVAARRFTKSQPISLGQSRFWFLRLLVDDATTFNVTLRFHLTGQMWVGDLERAVRVVTARHDSLRTCFIEDENEPDQVSQKILAHSAVKLERKTISSVEMAAAEYEQFRAHKFDLASGPLLRLALLTLSPTSHYLLVNYHHIIMDMASFQILTSELDKVYSRQSLGSPPRQYPDFSVAQRQALEKGGLQDKLEYWRGVFPADDQPSVLPLLPMARSSSRVALTDYDVHQASIRLEPALAARIKSVSKAQRCTPFHFYLAVFKSMLFSFTDAQDLTIGIADANRNDSSVTNTIGFLLNLLALRFRRRTHQRFSDAIVEARDTAYGALRNSELPFDALLEELNVARSPSYSPFFQTFFDYRQQTSDRQIWCNCQFDLEEFHPGRTAYDISLDVADLGSDIHVTIRVQKGLYDFTTANLLLETYTHLVSTFAQNISLCREDTPLFSEQQLARAVQVGLGPKLVTKWPATLPHRIDQVALENANKPSLVDGLGNSLTYAAMTKRIEAIAEALRKVGVGDTSRVLVYQQATADWICSMLAIMRIGGVYVPLDLRNPIPRLAAQAGHCQTSVVLADDTTVRDAPQLNVEIVIDVSCVANEPAAHIPNSAQPDAAAAILYTSGSTGNPKGIIVRHSGIRNEMEGYTETYKLGSERVLQQSAFTFDFSMDQIFTGLVNGGTVYVVPWNKRGDPLSITEIMQKESITYTKATPSEYSMWMQYGGDNLAQAKSWRFAFGGGEPMTKAVLKQFAHLDLEQLHLHNSYGPAEISIASHKGSINYDKESLDEINDLTVACGFSLPNYATYIIDENLKPLPVGMPGEIAIGGAGVSIGYLNNQELTACAFVPNPYATPEHISNGWTRLHRTGDIGHLQEDGSLVFRKRTAGDTQVKLRGLRIDLGDIENNIISTADGVLKEAVVTLREGDPDYLVAHVVFSPHNDVDDKDAFLQRLLGRLPIPQYMIPVLAAQLDKMPLTNHFKVDRRAIKNLALPQRLVPADANDKYHDGTEVTETMAQLRQTWRQVLPDSEKLGLAIRPSTSFFQVGGNSLLIVRLQSRIRSVFNVAVRLVEILSANTLGQMARRIEESARVNLIDWHVETAPPSIPSFLMGLSDRNDAEIKTLLVTGATGNLARHLLPLLVADSRVGKIHCVAVRDQPRQRQVSSDIKVTYHTGDLSLPLLGLGVDEFRYLAEQADVVLHLGATRSFWDDYHVLRPTNVHPTKELVKLAAPRRIPIHFISTSGVLPEEEILATGAAAARSAAAHIPPADGSNGYMASKWASERILERSSESPVGVSSFIYRLLPSSAQPHQRPEDLKRQVLDDFVRFTNIAGAIPDLMGWEGRLDLIPVDLVARWLCEFVLESKSGHSDPPQAAADSTEALSTVFLHLESPITIEVDELIRYVRENRGQETLLERLPILKWMGRIKTLGFPYILASHDATVRSSEGEEQLKSRR